MQHIVGYYVVVDEMDRFGNVKPMHKWIPGNSHAGLRWLAARRPEVYSEHKNLKHALSMDDAFLRFLDQMDEQAKLEKARNARLIEHKPDEDLVAIGSGASLEEDPIELDFDED